MPSSSSSDWLGVALPVGRPFAALGPLLTPAVFLMGPGRRGPASVLLAFEAGTPLIGTAMAGEIVTTAPPTMAAAQAVAAESLATLKVAA
jgi:hypothetical protein